MMFRVFTLLAVIVTVSFAHNPTPKPKSWWCRLKPTSSQCTSTANNSSQCCPTGGIWSSWKNKTACTDTCGGFGTQTLERTCLTESSCGPCSGSKLKTKVKCNPTPCKYPRNSCATGMKAFAKGSEILCFDPASLVEAVPKASCCPVGGIMEVGDWSSCNIATCGSCTVSKRSTTCRTQDYGCGPCSAQPTDETQPCQTKPCTFPQQSCCTPYAAKANGTQILCM